MKILNGLKPRVSDERDIHVGGLFSKIDISNIPDFYLSGGFAESQSPQELDECSAYMTCGASELQELIPLDRKYHFALSKCQDDDVDSFGTDLKNAISVSVKVGDLPRDKRPSNLEDKPLSFLRRIENWGTLYELAKPQKKKGYVWVNNFEEAISTMYKTKRAVMFGTYFDIPLSNDFMEGKWKNEESGHAMFLRGLKTINGKKYAIVQNSYGAMAGIQGCHFADKERIDASLNLFTGAVFVDYTPEELRTMLAQGKFIDNSWISNTLNYFAKVLKKLLLEVPTGRIPSLYDVGYSLLGQHLTLDYTVNKTVGCGQALSYVLKRYGAYIPKGGISGTAGMMEWLDKNAVEIQEPEVGCVIVSATGSGNGKVRGHCGVVGYRSIMSNSSLTGKWSCEWTIDKWLDYYKINGELSTKYYRI